MRLELAGVKPCGPDMKISLVLATIGRTDELARFLEHLFNQTYENYELIIVDQNPDERVATLLQPYLPDARVVHLRSEKGLSRSRNVGLKYVSGDLITFPDDDCWYPPGLLGDVVKYFLQYEQVSVLTCMSVDASGALAAARWDKNSGFVTRYNVWRRGISFTIFCKKDVASTVGQFDTTLGVGSGTPWGAGEETDYLIRSLENKFTIYYNPLFLVHHPVPVLHYGESDISRGLNYGRGIGRVLRKHNYPYWFVLYFLIRPLGGCAISVAYLNLPKARFHWSVFLGRLQGWRALL